MNSAFDIALKPEQFDALSADDASFKTIEELGGPRAVIDGLGSDISKGIRATDVDTRRESHGSNQMPEPEPVTFFEMFIESFEDATVLILMGSAVISLIVGLYEDPSTGWIEGTTILLAVLIVAVVTAVNNFKKQAQFRNLNNVKVW